MKAVCVYAPLDYFYERPVKDGHYIIALIAERLISEGHKIIAIIAERLIAREVGCFKGMTEVTHKHNILYYHYH